MGDLPTPENYQVYPKGPNFLHIVILSGIALFIMLILAYFILLGVGDILLPSVHQNGEATARLVRSAMSRLAA